MAVIRELHQGALAAQDLWGQALPGISPPVVPAPEPDVLRTVSALRRRVNAWRMAGERVALVPTMGALHAGHLRLVETAKAQAERVVVSIFVNPTQFGPNEDFDAYPRDEAGDVAKLSQYGTDLVFTPEVSEIYPEGFSAQVTVAGVTEGLCGARRPGHFAGVTTVVTKLLLQCLPDVACFGEKDYQQLQVIRRLVRDLDIPVRIKGVPTIRESDGLAMSSRNAYLSPADRALAPRLYQVLTESARRMEAGESVATVLTQGRAALAIAGFSPIDYFELRAAEGLVPMDRLDRPGRLLAAAKLGRTRLIDNVPVGGDGTEAT